MINIIFPLYLDRLFAPDYASPPPPPAALTGGDILFLVQSFSSASASSVWSLWTWYMYILNNLELTLKLQPCIDIIEVTDEFNTWWPWSKFWFRFLKILSFRILPLNSVYWSQTIKIDCYLQGHIGIQTSKMLFSVSKIYHFINFTFQLEQHLNVSDWFEK